MKKERKKKTKVPARKTKEKNSRPGALLFAMENPKHKKTLTEFEYEFTVQNKNEEKQFFGSAKDKGKTIAPESLGWAKLTHTIVFGLMDPLGHFQLNKA